MPCRVEAHQLVRNMLSSTWKCANARITKPGASGLRALVKTIITLGPHPTSPREGHGPQAPMWPRQPLLWSFRVRRCGSRSPRTHGSALRPRTGMAPLGTAVCRGLNCGGTCSGCQRPHRQLQGYSAATIMHEEVIRAEAKQAGAEMYLASFPLAGHAGPLPPRCARQSSYRSDQSQSRRGARETVLGGSLGKINTLQDLRQAATLTSTLERRQTRRLSLRG